LSRTVICWQPNHAHLSEKEAASGVSFAGGFLASEAEVNFEAALDDCAVEVFERGQRIRAVGGIDVAIRLDAIENPQRRHLRSQRRVYRSERPRVRQTFAFRDTTKVTDAP
jgi:hypothetical protein